MQVKEPAVGIGKGLAEEKALGPAEPQQGADNCDVSQCHSFAHQKPRLQVSIQQPQNSPHLLCILVACLLWCMMPSGGEYPGTGWGTMSESAKLTHTAVDHPFMLPLEYFPAQLLIAHIVGNGIALSQTHTQNPSSPQSIGNLAGRKFAEKFRGAVMVWPEWKWGGAEARGP